MFIFLDRECSDIKRSPRGGAEYFLRRLILQQAFGSFTIHDSGLMFPGEVGHSTTISGTTLFGLAFGLPAAVAVLCNAVQPHVDGRLSVSALRRGVRDCHHMMLSLFEAFALAATAKTWLNKAVGRQRPDWYARLATGDAALIAEGRLSYPSGHAAYSHFAGAVRSAVPWYPFRQPGVVAYRILPEGLRDRRCAAGTWRAVWVCWEPAPQDTAPPQVVVSLRAAWLLSCRLHWQHTWPLHGSQTRFVIRAFHFVRPTAGSSGSCLPGFAKLSLLRGAGAPLQ